jgi:hypothetical protein
MAAGRQIAHSRENQPGTAAQAATFYSGTVCTAERRTMAHCVTCGAELHPDRAKKYDYCMAKECQEKNARGLTMVAVGVNKAAEQFLILDDATREELASGKYRDQRRGLSGPSAPAHSPRPAPRSRKPADHGAGQDRPRPNPAPRPPWTKSQEKLALLYNAQGLRPAEIAEKLGISQYLVTQIILSGRNRKKA